MRAKTRENRGGNDGNSCRKEQEFPDFCRFFPLPSVPEKEGCRGVDSADFEATVVAYEGRGRVKVGEMGRKLPFSVGWISTDPYRQPSTPGTAKVGELRGVSGRLTGANYATCGMAPKHPSHLPHAGTKTAASPHADGQGENRRGLCRTPMPGVTSRARPAHWQRGTRRHGKEGEIGGEKLHCTKNPDEKHPKTLAFEYSEKIHIIYLYIIWFVYT